MTPPEDAGRLLLPLARGAIAERLGRHADPIPAAAWLDEPGASFITLNQAGRLRGCIGSLSAYRSLIDDVRGNAAQAAFHDPRFPPLGPDELDRTHVEVSVLSAAEELPVRSEAEALAALRPGIDGVILEEGRHRATFLPQVWDQLPEPADFLGRLRLKAGLREDAWSARTRLSRYTVTSWEE